MLETNLLFLDQELMNASYFCIFLYIELQFNDLELVNQSFGLH